MLTDVQTPFLGTPLVPLKIPFDMPGFPSIGEGAVALMKARTHESIHRHLETFTLNS